MYDIYMYSYSCATHTEHTHTHIYVVQVHLLTYIFQTHTFISDMCVRVCLIYIRSVCKH